MIKELSKERLETFNPRDRRTVELLLGARNEAGEGLHFKVESYDNTHLLGTLLVELGQQKTEEIDKLFSIGPCSLGSIDVLNEPIETYRRLDYFMGDSKKGLSVIGHRLQRYPRGLDIAERTHLSIYLNMLYERVRDHCSLVNL